MKRVFVTESKSTTIELSAEQAQVLDALGRKLAGKASWWGEDDESPPASVIDVSRDPNGVWSILVREAVGVISVDDLEIVVSPKIPSNHFLYLACESGIFPRIEVNRTEIDPAKSLWEVIAHWFVHAVERVLHAELAKGYHETKDELELSRGRILAIETAQAFYQGRPVVACEFEEFSEDIALNRLLKGACDLVAGSPRLDRELRHRARTGLARMTDVGGLQYSDFRAQVDRLTFRYGDAIGFAKILLQGGGTKISHGATQGWCFLIRTPELVEAGVRSVLRRHIGSRWTVEKRSKTLSGIAFTLNPDLVFDRCLAVGDVKYKILDTDWRRTDLYQTVAFAVGYECTCAAVIGFRNETSLAIPSAVQFGEIEMGAFAWDAGISSDPRASGWQLSEEVATFLGRAVGRNNHLEAA